MFIQIIVILIGVAIVADQVEIALWEIACDRRAAEARRRRYRNH